jgi:hypothetical protein
MMITRKHLSRRTFIRGTFGAAVALPFLDAMVPAFAADQSTAPFRFGVVYMPCGVYPDTWHPAQTGSDFEFKPVMQPLAPYRNQMVTISKLQAPWGESVHVGASSAFLNGIGPIVERGSTGDSFSHLQSRKTLDQFIADHVAGGLAAAFDRGRHRGHGDRGRCVRRLSLRPLRDAGLA